jgi:DNA-binding response OmpR family regulator
MRQPRSIEIEGERMAATVLIVANEKTATAALAAPFGKREFSVLTAHSGRQALAQAKTRLPDAVIVDATSARLNCARLCRSLRAETYAIIIVLVLNPAKAEPVGGASFFLPKSITPRKLVQRVRAALEDKPPREMRVGNLTLDTERRRLTRGNKTHQLTPKEFDLLKLFMERRDQTVSRKVLMKEVWKTEYLGDTRTLDVHIRWLREKIEENASHPIHLITVRGQGYRLEGK